MAILSLRVECGRCASEISPRGLGRSKWRRFSTCGSDKWGRRAEFLCRVLSGTMPIANRRYSRLKICATSLACDRPRPAWSWFHALLHRLCGLVLPFSNLILVDPAESQQLFFVVNHFFPA